MAKIFIAASMHFAKEMVKAAELLRERGYETAYAPDTEDCVRNPELNEDEEHCFNNDIIRASMEIQEKCDAILVLNHKKDEQEGYIGANVLIELGLAYYLKQKIFLLNNIPGKDVIRHAVEVMHMRPIILNGDIKKIKEYL